MRSATWATHIQLRTPHSSCKYLCFFLLHSRETDEMNYHSRNMSPIPKNIVSMKEAHIFFNKIFINCLLENRFISHNVKYTTGMQKTLFSLWIYRRMLPSQLTYMSKTNVSTLSNILLVLFDVLYLLTNGMVSLITYLDQLWNPIKCIVSLSLGEKLARPILYSTSVRDYHNFSGSSGPVLALIESPCIFSGLLVSPTYKDIPTILLQLE